MQLNVGKEVAAMQEMPVANLAFECVRARGRRREAVFQLAADASPDRSSRFVVDAAVTRR